MHGPALATIPQRDLPPSYLFTSHFLSQKLLGRTEVEGIPHHFGPIAEASVKQDHHTYFQEESRNEVTQGRLHEL